MLQFEKENKRDQNELNVGILFKKLVTFRTLPARVETRVFPSPVCISATAPA